MNPLMNTLKVFLPAAFMVACTMPSVEAARPSTIRISLQPARVPQPILRYRLSPPVSDLVSGDPWMRYRKARDLAAGLGANVMRVLDPPDDEEITPAKVETALTAARQFFREMDAGARTQQCGMAAARASHLGLEDHEIRNMARLLLRKLRHEITTSKHESALRTIQTLLAFSWHVADDLQSISFLVAIAIQRDTLDQVIELMSASDRPNLYWALTILPQRFELPAIVEKDINGVYATPPVLRGDFTKVDRETLEDLITGFAPAALEGKDVDAVVKADYSLIVAQIPAAKVGKVDIATMREAVLRNALQIRQAFAHRHIAIASLAFPDQQREMRKLATDMSNVKGTVARAFTEALPPDFVELIPLVEQTVAVLRVVDAVSNHLAAHGNNVPLGADTTYDLPLPKDPFTDKPFSIQRRGNEILVDTAPVPTPRPMHCRIKLKQSKAAR